jgi:hypothetical protein
MNWSKYGTLAMILVFVFTVSAITVHFGYTVAGVPQAGMEVSRPGFLALWDWAWDMCSFLFDMSTFRIDEMPLAISGIFDVLEILALFLGISLIRGN